MIDKAFVSSLPAPILFVDESLTIAGASNAVSSIFGRRCFHESPERNLKELTSFLTDTEVLADSLRTSISTLKTPGAHNMFRWQHNQRIYNVGVFLLSVSEKALFAAFFEDKTDYVTMTQLNDRARSYLESIMSSLHLGIIVADRDLLVTNMNRAQEQIFAGMGMSISLIHAIGQPLSDLFPDEEPVLEQVKRDVLESGVAFGGIREHIELDGKEKAFAVSFSPLRDEPNQITGMIRTCEDVTEKEQLESELRDAETRNLQVDAVKKVIITLNHEINNALLSITANAELLLRAGAADCNRNVLENIVSCADKIAGVTKQLGALKEIKTREYLDGGPEMIDTEV